MACQCYRKSSVMAYNTASQSAATGGVVQFSNSTVTGSSITFSNPSLNLNKAGLYEVTYNVSAAGVGTSASNITIQIYRNGVALPSSISTATSDSATDIVNLTVTAIVDVLPSCVYIDNDAELTLVNTGAAATISNVNLVAIKEA